MAVQTASLWVVELAAKLVAQLEHRSVGWMVDLTVVWLVVERCGCVLGRDDGSAEGCEEGCNEGCEVGCM